MNRLYSTLAVLALGLLVAPIGLSAAETTSTDNMADQLNAQQSEKVQQEQEQMNKKVEEENAERMRKWREENEKRMEEWKKQNQPTQ